MRGTLFILCSLLCFAQDQADQIVEEEMRKQHISGAAIAVLREGRPLKLRGYGRAATASGDGQLSMAGELAKWDPALHGPGWEPGDFQGHPYVRQTGPLRGFQGQFVRFLDDSRRGDSQEVTELEFHYVQRSLPFDGGFNVLLTFFAGSETTLTEIRLYNCDFGEEEDGSLSHKPNRHGHTDLSNPQSARCLARRFSFRFDAKHAAVESAELRWLYFGCRRSSRRSTGTASESDFEDTGSFQL